MFETFMQKFVRFLDPKLEKFRSHESSRHSSKAKSKSTSKPPAPQTLSEFIDLLRRTPQSVLSSTDRNRIAAVMSFNDRTVKDLMIPKKDMVFVNEKEFLGPLVLDKLYKSGFTNFPVVDRRDKVKGIIHTEALNALEIKTADRAEKYLDKNVAYLHTSDSLTFAVQEIERTNSYYFLVLDDSDTLAGFFTTELLLSYLLN